MLPRREYRPDQRLARVSNNALRLGPYHGSDSSAGPADRLSTREALTPTPTLGTAGVRGLPDFVRLDEGRSVGCPASGGRRLRGTPPDRVEGHLEKDRI